MAGSTYDLNKLGSILFKDRDTRDPWINHLDEKYYIKHRFQKPGNVIEIDGSDIHLPQDAAPARWFGPDVDPAELPLMKDKYLRQPTVLAQGLPEIMFGDDSKFLESLIAGNVDDPNNQPDSSYYEAYGTGRHPDPTNIKWSKKGTPGPGYRPLDVPLKRV